MAVSAPIALELGLGEVMQATDIMAAETWATLSDPNVDGLTRMRTLSSHLICCAISQEFPADDSSPRQGVRHEFVESMVRTGAERVEAETLASKLLDSLDIQRVTFSLDYASSGADVKGVEHYSNGVSQGTVLNRTTFIRSIIDSAADKN